ncbi:ATP-grasp fold amidoligase family protein [Providencia rettgeri]
MNNYNLLKLIPLRFRLKLYYLLKFKRYLNLNNPKLYTEKLQYRKLNLLPIYSELSDKYLVRKFIKNRIGEQYLIPLISSHNDTSSINFELLPPKFVIKTNFGSGDEHIEIVKNKKEISQSGIISKFNKAMNSSYKGTILGENQYESIEKKSSLKSLLKVNSEILMTSNSMYLTLKMVFYK